MLHNIFKKSKRKKKRTPKPKIIIDLHEKNSLVPSYLKEKNIDIDFRHLKIGDYIIGKTIIERKTYSDFISSMIKRRLMQQLKNLQRQKQSLVIIEGNELDESNLSKSVRGQILTIIFNYQIPIIFSQDTEDTAEYLTTLAKQQLKKPLDISLHSKIPKTKKEQLKYVIESFPGIGPKTAEKLLKKFKTISNIINADEQELRELIGKKADFLISLRYSKF